LRYINLDKIPARPKGAGGAVGHKEEAIRQSRDGCKKRGAGSRGSCNKRVIRRTNRDSSISRHGNRRSGRCRRRGRSSVGIVDIPKLE
jgi:hypothetical protein